MRVRQLIFLATLSILVSCSSSTNEHFVHRGYLGWMIEITPWGLFTNKFWEPEIGNTIDSLRDSMVREIIDLAHQHRSATCRDWRLPGTG
jgi:hypothetical protein